MMNAFRLAGDMSHVASILILLLRLRTSKSALGVSLKTQELFLLVFVTRYIDLFTAFYSIYNSIMKVLYIASTAYIVYMIRHQEPYKSKYDRSQDSFLHWKYAAAPAALVSLATVALQRNFDVVEILWTFSIYLEPLAIIPQLIVLQRYKEVENLTGNYIFFMGSYRALYILNWVYRSYYEPYYRHHWIVYACGIAQTALYIDFFYYFVTAKYYGQKLSLPT